ncbi:MAG: LCCL domain-containing protein [Steroidobacteraceae bacterium]
MRMLRGGFSSLIAGVLLLSALPTFAQKSLGITVTQSAEDFRQEIGKLLTFVCPATDGAKANVYGTDTYASYSPICAAAIHAGVLRSRRAGAVTILMGSGAKSFRGSERNGVVSHEYGAWGYSYTFARDGEPGTINWQTTWDPWSQIPAKFTAPVAVTCPPEGNTDNPIWGTDFYQRDSGVCVAAVHAGVISVDKGGVVAIKRVPGPQREFAGTDRFRVSSKRWGAQPDGFAVTAATQPDVGSSAPPPPPPSAPPLRTIALAGFTAMGSASQPGPIAPRALALAGFAAVGSAPGNTSIGPQTIQTPPWIGVGSAP